ncbi:Zn2 DNA-binding protein [Venustampulla echinocandica]|uniref:Zn2 DNA-binding protein n=1 Tax=Venustampulla echinocandica TaxID=2656787 RepID=A0A370TMW9_9HELO|nr:Zn2 DNA-binding protein [Venustampulla echinocandica]RDL36876.1 Zn2 DNA-binding protein [Venustampulla echinocandica]
MMKSRRPKTNCQRTFTACWTCRRRNVRCDNAVPHCAQCQRMRIPCEGYHIRLVWVNTTTGAYVPQQRRAYPCELTWKGYPNWTLKEVGHLIDHCELRQCRCTLHQALNPFSTFPQSDDVTEVDADDEMRISELASEKHSDNEQALDVCSPTACETDIRDQSTVMSIVRSDASHLFGNTALSHGENRTPINNKDMDFPPRQNRVNFSMSIIQSPSQSLTPSGLQEENFLFFHYVSYVSVQMTPIDDERNPWRSTYPSIAVQGAKTSSTDALYHAILAQSAYNIANLKGPGRGNGEKASAMRYSGKAIQELRRSLELPKKDYCSVLAALLTIMLAEHVFHRNSQGWQNHIRGAIGFVSQYLTQQPWMLSHDAWIITQNFVLSTVISQTACSCTTSSLDHIDEMYGMLDDVIARPSFGYTIGGTTRLIRMIYQTRRIEVQLAITGYKRGIQEMNEDVLVQVEDIIRQLETPFDDEVEMYMEQHEPNDLKVLPRTRQLVKLHLHLFNGAAMIYLLCMVLQYPPSTVASYVSEVLINTMAFVDMDSNNVSVWPVFIAMVEAYTSESLELSNRYLASSDVVAGNRKDIGRVVRQVWADREELATRRQCDLGEVSVNWRDVMKRLDLDILLL